MAIPGGFDNASGQGSVRWRFFDGNETPINLTADSTLNFTLLSLDSYNVRSKGPKIKMGKKK